MVLNKGLEIKLTLYLGAQKLKKAMLAAIYIYPAYIEYWKKYGTSTKKENPSESLKSLVTTLSGGKKRLLTGE